MSNLGFGFFAKPEATDVIAPAPAPAPMSMPAPPPAPALQEPPPWDRPAPRDLARRLLAHAPHAGGEVTLPDPASLEDFAGAGALLKRGEAAQAAALYGRLLASRPGFAPGWTMLGLCLEQLGDRAGGVACHEAALRLAPDFAEARLCLVAALLRDGALPRAEASCAESPAAGPDPALRALHGAALAGLGRHAEAAAAFAEAAPHLPPVEAARARLGQGSALHALGRGRAALDAYREASRLRPDCAEALANAGCLLLELGEPEEAAACCRRAVALQPGHAGAQRNLGAALHALGCLAEAAACYRAVLAIEPGNADAHNYLGVAHADANRAEQAEPFHRAALALAPERAEIHLDRAMSLLKAGHLEEGFAAYEWRWRGPMPPHGLAMPQWRGEPLRGRSILLHAEQGLGDSIQFARYAPLAALGGRVTLEVQPALVRLMQGLPHVERVIPSGGPRPDCELHCPLMSLPAAFGTTTETIPARIPYLRADPALVEAWRRRIPAGAGPRIGLVWAGDARPGQGRAQLTDRRRSMPFASLAPLLAVPGPRWFSLQLGPAAAQAAGAAGLIDLTAGIEDFADTAALMANMDLVVAVDTSCAHLAGALGRPVWMLSRFDGCWRWLQDREDTPWYPTMRLYRQAAPGDWEGAARRAAADLARETAQIGA